MHSTTGGVLMNASQEFEFHRVVPIGTTVTCHGNIEHKLQRGRLNLITLGITVLDQDDKQILTGKATVAAPG